MSLIEVNSEGFFAQMPVKQVRFLYTLYAGW